jgi:hypothetical protein
MTTTQRYQADYYRRRVATSRCIDCGGAKCRSATKTRCASCAAFHREVQNERYKEMTK